MRAFVLDQTGQPPGLRDVEMPAPGQGAVRVRVAACALNFADLLTIEGRYQEKPALPATLGMEIAGWIEARGPDTDAPPDGTPVAAFVGGGGLADYAVVGTDRLIPLAETADLAVAASIPIAYGTSHLALDRCARLAAGETLVVTGAAGGVGLTAVEIGHRMGARVIAIARGEERLAIARRAGADVGIDGAAEDVTDRIRALGGADVVYDAVGGTLFDSLMRATRPGGRLIPIGFASGDVPQIAANRLLVKNLTVIGVYWGGYFAFAPQVVTASLRTIFDWWAAGDLHPHVSHRLPLERADEALTLLRERRSTGKVVVMPGD